MKPSPSRFVAFCLALARGLRRTQAALRDGSYEALNREDPDELAWLRANPAPGDSVAVALNMSSEARTPSLDLRPYGIDASTATPLLTSSGTNREATPLTAIRLAPLGVWIGAVR